MTDQETDQVIFDLYDQYCCGQINRRGFLSCAATLTIDGISALALDQNPLPHCTKAQTISFTNKHVKARYVA